MQLACILLHWNNHRIARTNEVFHLSELLCEYWMAIQCSVTDYWTERAMDYDLIGRRSRGKLGRVFERAELWGCFGYYGTFYYRNVNNGVPQDSPITPHVQKLDPTSRATSERAITKSACMRRGSLFCFVPVYQLIRRLLCGGRVRITRVTVTQSFSITLHYHFFKRHILKI